MKGKPKYTYSRSGNVFVIREWTYTETGAQGTKKDEKYSEDEALKEVYRLNGWKLKAANYPLAEADGKGYAV